MLKFRPTFLVSPSAVLLRFKRHKGNVGGRESLQGVRTLKLNTITYSLVKTP